MNDTIHVVSATSVYADDTRDPNNTVHLAMCGERLGAYAEVSRVHPVANYLVPTSPSLQRVTCEPCRARILSGN